MVFNSLQYALFLPLVLLLARILRDHVPARNAMLLAASYYFYGVWDWRFLALLCFSTVVDYGVGRCLGPVPAAGPGQQAERRRRQRLVAVSCAVNLSILGFFKYFGFFTRSAAVLLAAIGIPAPEHVLNIVLPVGISFYTFQSMSYTIDVYRGHLPPERNLLTFATYVAFFPQLVAGPIQRATALIPQLERRRRIRREDLYFGTYLIFWGLFKKVVLADNAAPIADKVFSAEHATGLTTVVGVYAFAVQIYCDFSGYTDIARGSARLLGFDLMLNFNHPYFATDPSDFWRRWHISLSTWLRDYLYIPLGGNRKGEGRTYVNLMITMLLGGLWHGAAWNFVLWGAYHGGLLCVHRLWRRLAGQGSPGPPAPWSAGWMLRVALFFQLTCLGWLLFRAGSARQVGDMLSSLVLHPTLDRELLTETDLLFFLGTGGIMLFSEVSLFRSGDDAAVFRWPVPVRALAYAAAILAFVCIGNFHGSQFIYFQF